jgi:hypothetical protein
LNIQDSSIAFICYYIEKGNRVELRELNVSKNNFGKAGIKALKGLKDRFKNI